MLKYFLVWLALILIFSVAVGSLHLPGVVNFLVGLIWGAITAELCIAHYADRH